MRLEEAVPGGQRVDESVPKPISKEIVSVFISKYTKKITVFCRFVGIGGARIFSGKFSGTSATLLRLRFCPFTLMSKSLPTMAAVFSNWKR